MCCRSWSCSRLWHRFRLYRRRSCDRSWCWCWGRSRCRSRGLYHRSHWGRGRLRHWLWLHGRGGRRRDGGRGWRGLRNRCRSRRRLWRGGCCRWWCCGGRGTRGRPGSLSRHAGRRRCRLRGHGGRRLRGLGCLTSGIGGSADRPASEVLEGPESERHLDLEALLGVLVPPRSQCLLSRPYRGG